MHRRVEVGAAVGRSAGAEQVQREVGSQVDHVGELGEAVGDSAHPAVVANASATSHGSSTTTSPRPLTQKQQQGKAKASHSGKAAVQAQAYLPDTLSLLRLRTRRESRDYDHTVATAGRRQLADSVGADSV